MCLTYDCVLLNSLLSFILTFGITIKSHRSHFRPMYVGGQSGFGTDRVHKIIFLAGRVGSGRGRKVTGRIRSEKWWTTVLCFILDWTWHRYSSPRLCVILVFSLMLISKWHCMTMTWHDTLSSSVDTTYSRMLWCSQTATLIGWLTDPSLPSIRSSPLLFAVLLSLPHPSFRLLPN